MTNIDLPLVLTFLRPGAEWALNGDKYDGLTWIGPGDPPTETECVEAWANVQTQLANDLARSNRHQAFTVESDPLFFEWQRGEGTEQAWRDKVEEIRQRYPYPS